MESRGLSRTGTTHYLNADFDLSLRSGAPERQLKLELQTRELSLQALHLAQPGDSLCLPLSADPDYLDYLQRHELPLPRLLRHPQLEADQELSPFGWNEETIALNASQSKPVAHPPLEVVRRVNSRRFGAELEEELFPREIESHVIRGIGEADDLLRCFARPGGWILKADHANAGLGNRRLRDAELTEADRRFVERRLSENDALVAEPWLDRQRDWSFIFDVPFLAEGFRTHETIMTRDGAFLGALFTPTDPLEGEFEPIARSVATALGSEGYFGPVCVDALEWNDEGSPRLRRLVDINARRSMSEAGYRLARRLSPAGTSYYRFYNRRKLKLPDSIAELTDSLGERHYDPTSRRGIFIASPLRMSDDDRSWTPGKLAVLLIGRSQSDALEMDRWFRERYER